MFLKSNCLYFPIIASVVDFVIAIYSVMNIIILIFENLVAGGVFMA